MKQRSATRTSTTDDFIELLSSMRFAISLLTVLAIASVIGTVVQQNLPPNTYLNLFGQFWDPVFSGLGLYAVYNSAWFIIILGFLVLSTTLCIVRLFTPMVREIRSFRENAREASLRHFTHQASLKPTLPPEARISAVTQYLTHAGFRFRVARRENDSTLVAAKQGSFARIGYFLTHGAIVLICLGGLLDSSVPLSLQIRLQGKIPAPLNSVTTISEIPQSARLESGNWSFRGNLYIPEDRAAQFVEINVNDGILLQPLPFVVQLKRFHIDHYETGSPKYYASDIVVVDHDNGKVFERKLEVNKPFEYRGVTLYQSGFDDRSKLRFTLHDVASSTEIEAQAGDSFTFPASGHTLEIVSFQPVNFENVAAPGSETSGRPGTVFLGSGATSSPDRMRNLGPLVTYVLRDSAGQAREFRHYMQPIAIGPREYLITGERASMQGEFSWLRIPVDEDNSADTWFAIRKLFFDPEQHAALVERFASGALDKNEKGSMRSIAQHTLTSFARGGMHAVFEGLNIPEDKMEEAELAFFQVIQGLVWNAWMMTREAAGKEVLDPNNVNALASSFANDTLFALSTSLRHSPLHLQLISHEQQYATILQATRSPGKPLVYFGSFLLTVGVFIMLYIRERRLFVLFKEDEALVAMSSGRKTIDLDEAFARHRDGLAALLGASTLQD